MTIDAELNRLPSGWRLKKLVQYGDPLDNAKPINRWACVVAGPGGAATDDGSPNSLLCVRRAVQNAIDRKIG